MVDAMAAVLGTVTSVALVLGMVHLTAGHRVVASVCVVIGTVTGVGRVAVLIVLIMHRVFLFHRIIPPGRFDQ
jgi:hypothetical protein